MACVEQGLSKSIPAKRNKWIDPWRLLVIKSHYNTELLGRPSFSLPAFMNSE
jgi:hypothetical protein